MNLNELEIGQKATITGVHAEGELKYRLYSFGIRPDTEVTMKNISLNRANMQILIQKSLTNLRAEEAQQIAIQELK